MNDTGERKWKMIESENEEFQFFYFPVMEEIADKYSYWHVFLIPPESQPFVNIYPEENEFFEWMQTLCNEEIKYKHRLLLDSKMVKKEEICISVKLKKKPKGENRPPGDSRKICIFIGEKEEVLTLVKFVNEQLQIMDENNQTVSVILNTLEREI